MSNPLSVRRVMVQTLKEDGTPDGEPMYGVMTADDFQAAYNDAFTTFEELEKAIQKCRSVIEVVQSDGVFDLADHAKIGHNNFYGKDWEK